MCLDQDEAAGSGLIQGESAITIQSLIKDCVSPVYLLSFLALRFSDWLLYASLRIGGLGTPWGLRGRHAVSRMRFIGLRRSAGWLATQLDVMSPGRYMRRVSRGQLDLFPRLESSYVFGGRCGKRSSMRSVSRVKAPVEPVVEVNILQSRVEDK